MDITIQLSSVLEVKKFIQIINNSKYNDIIAKSNNSINSVVNAKSILGLFSLDLQKPIVISSKHVLESSVLKELEIFKI